MFSPRHISPYDGKIVQKYNKKINCANNYDKKDKIACVFMGFGIIRCQLQDTATVFSEGTHPAGEGACRRYYNWRPKLQHSFFCRPRKLLCNNRALAAKTLQHIHSPNTLQSLVVP